MVLLSHSVKLKAVKFPVQSVASTSKFIKICYLGIHTNTKKSKTNYLQSYFQKNIQNCLLCEKFPVTGSPHVGVFHQFPQVPHGNTEVKEANM